jgi:hypothetical protein
MIRHVITLKDRVLRIARALSLIRRMSGMCSLVVLVLRFSAGKSGRRHFNLRSISTVKILKPRLLHSLIILFIGLTSYGCFLFDR